MISLDRLEALLRRRACTAREVAQHFGCCVPTAHRRLKELSERSAVSVVRDTERKPGPVAKRYRVT